MREQFVHPLWENVKVGDEFGVSLYTYTGSKLEKATISKITSTTISLTCGERTIRCQKSRATAKSSSSEWYRHHFMPLKEYEQQKVARANTQHAREIEAAVQKIIATVQGIRGRTIEERQSIAQALRDAATKIEQLV